jgi:hypothetical protein
MAIADELNINTPEKKMAKEHKKNFAFMVSLLLFFIPLGISCVVFYGESFFKSTFLIDDPYLITFTSF